MPLAVHNLVSFYFSPSFLLSLSILTPPPLISCFTTCHDPVDLSFFHQHRFYFLLYLFITFAFFSIFIFFSLDVFSSILFVFSRIYTLFVTILFTWYRSFCHCYFFSSRFCCILNFLYFPYACIRAEESGGPRAPVP